MKESKFIHISDLHFFHSNHLKSRKDGLSHFKVKRQILGYIGWLIQEQDIGAVLISGDLELDSADSFIPFLKEWIKLGCKVFIVFGEHDTKASRKELIHKTNNLEGLYIFEEYNFINDNTLNYSISGMSCDSKQNGFSQKLASLVPHNHTKPAIFLTHPCNLTRKKMKELGCTYYAVGHEHSYSIETVKQNMYIGRPGHLYSLWDGNGKAWPVGGIIGEFRNNKLVLTWKPFPVPQTVRLFLDPHRSYDGKTPVVIENCSYDKGLLVKRFLEGKWVYQNFRGEFVGFIRQGMDNLELMSIIKNILTVFTDDIFVTPSDSGKMKKKYGYSRGVFSANTLLSDPLIFEEFIERSSKASKKTQ